MRRAAGMMAVLAVLGAPRADAYITAPVQTLGQLCGSTYVTLVRVEKVSQEKGIILYRKVRDLKGVYPRDTIRHAFDLKNTPAHKGLGDVPVRPDAVDWAYALKWAEAGKTAVIFALKYDPYGDFGHTYIDRCWYATMCPNRDWDFWYSIYSDAALLTRWHCGTPAQLASAVEQVLAGKTAVVPSLAEGTKDDLRQGRGKIKGLKIGLQIQAFDPNRDWVAGYSFKELPVLIQELGHGDRQVRLQALRDLGTAGPEASSAAPKIVPFAQDPDEELRLAALDALAEIRPEPKLSLPVLTKSLSGTSPRVRVAAARALARLQPDSPDLVPALLPLLKEPAVALAAAELLAETPERARAAGPALAAPLAALLADPARETRLRAAAALGALGAAGVPALVQAMKDPDRDVRVRTAETLAKLGPEGKAAVPVLAETVCKDPSGTVRMRSADALARIGPAAQAARASLETAMKDPMMAQRPEVLAKLREVHALLR